MSTFALDRGMDMKKRTGTKSTREMNRDLQTEMIRDEAQRLEQQRIDFEHGARLARTNLYGLERKDQRGWVDASRK